MRKNIRKFIKKIRTGINIIPLLIIIFVMCVPATTSAAGCGFVCDSTTDTPDLVCSKLGATLRQPFGSVDAPNCTGEPNCTLGYARPICCCQPEGSLITPVSGAQTPKTPKFIMPELQINIPTLKLTASSSINYITDDKGNTNVAIPWISEYIIAIYNYGLSVAGILAAIVLMAGGVLWLVSGGDASKVTQAKELITGSVIGLVILASSYVLLIQVNPNLVKFKPISIGTIKYSDSEPVSNDGNIDNGTACDNCVDLTIDYKDGNQINADLADKLTMAWNNSNGLKWQVTEAYPPDPAVTHASACHYNGRCADVALTTDRSCAAVDDLITILENAGLSVLNEYTGCGGTRTANTTGGHLHVH
ncbi:MAG: pilin [Candidatus Falkowbacteria bacterium]|nr:pilin [Candidatus Falkowbacteria bacterium]